MAYSGGIENFEKVYRSRFGTHLSLVWFVLRWDDLW